MHLVGHCKLVVIISKSGASGPTVITQASLLAGIPDGVSGV